MHPYLLHFGHFALPTFGALAALGLMAALGLSLCTARLAGLPPDALWDAGLFALISVFVFSRVLLVVLHPQAFLRYQVLLLAVPSLTAPGLVLTASATAAWLWAKRLPGRPALDAWAPCGTLIWAALSLGHFAEGSDPGVAVGTAGRTVPVALLAALTAFLFTTALYKMLERRLPTAAIGLISVGTAQFVLSFWREPGIAYTWGLDELQWVALGMIVSGGVLLMSRVT